jgi:hypothetical protein
MWPPARGDVRHVEDIRCEYFDACPICGSSEKIKLLWILAYCKTRRFEECARHRARQTGEMPDFTLLPDGTYMTPDIEALVREHVEECKRLEGRA